METAFLVDLGREGLWLAVLLAAPVTAAALLVGLAVGIFQAASQVQEFTLSFVPKILAVLLVLAWTAPWIGQHLVRFASLALGGGI